MARILIARVARKVAPPHRGRFRCRLVMVASVGMAVSLTACGSSGPAESYQQGWDRAINSPGNSCQNVPARVTSRSDWTNGCMKAQGFLRIHDTTGHVPTPTPTTYSGDP